MACPLLRATVPPHGFAGRDSARVVLPFRVSPLRASSPLLLHSNRASARRDSRNQAQDMRVLSGRVLRACRARTSLGCSALQGLTAWTLDWISPVSPLPFLPSPRGRWLEPQGLDRSSLRQVVVCTAEAAHPFQSTSPSWASYPRTLTCCFGSGPRRAH